MAVRIITPPTEYPLTLAEVKAHLRVDHTDEDTMITAYLAAATAHAEKFLGRALMTQTLELVLDSFYDPQIMIPMPPLQSVVSVLYDDGAGDEQTLVLNTDYVVDTASQPGWVVAVAGTWPTTIDTVNSVRIRYIAGYVNTNDSPPSAAVPFDIKAAILLLVGSLYGNRESVVVGVTTSMVPWSAEQLLRQHRVELALA
jgi:uncharacterized phiE125 gp8 family phage protein